MHLTAVVIQWLYSVDEFLNQYLCNNYVSSENAKTMWQYGGEIITCSTQLFGALLQVSHLYYFGFTLAALIAPFSASQQGANFREIAPKTHCTLPARHRAADRPQWASKRGVRGDEKQEYWLTFTRWHGHHCKMKDCVNEQLFASHISLKGDDMSMLCLQLSTAVAGLKSALSFEGYFFISKANNRRDHSLLYWQTDIHNKHHKTLWYSTLQLFNRCANKTAQNIGCGKIFFKKSKITTVIVSHKVSVCVRFTKRMTEWKDFES